MDREIKVEVERSPQRCPYCHDEVDSRDEDWLACAGCLARHHEDCWRELGRCSSCGDDRSLALGAHASAGSVTTIRPTRTRSRTRARFTRATREKIHEALWCLEWVAIGALVAHFWAQVGCFTIFVAWWAHSAIDSVVRGILGLDRKKPKKKKSGDAHGKPPNRRPTKVERA